jgi:hypothetical protein
LHCNNGKIINFLYPKFIVVASQMMVIFFISCVGMASSTY